MQNSLRSFCDYAVSPFLARKFTLARALAVKWHCENYWKTLTLTCYCKLTSCWAWWEVEFINSLSICVRQKSAEFQQYHDSCVCCSWSFIISYLCSCGLVFIISKGTSRHTHVKLKEDQWSRTYEQWENTAFTFSVCFWSCILQVF